MSPGKLPYCSPAAMSVQAVAAPDLVVDTPVVMTCLPVFKSELADRPGPVYDYSYMYVGPPITRALGLTLTQKSLVKGRC